jgi:hypothetical protein
MGTRSISREDFDAACEAVWSEIRYQDTLPRRTDEDEAKDVPGFLTLGRRYLRKAEDAWSDEKGRADATDARGLERFAYTRANEHVRKLAAIFVRAMVYTGIFPR